MSKSLRRAVQKAIKYAGGEAWDAARSIYSDPFIDIERIIDGDKTAKSHSDPDRTDFHLGMLAALAIVALYDNQTMFDEIVNSADAAKLVKVARRDGQMRISGLSKYGYGKRYPK